MSPCLLYHLGKFIDQKTFNFLCVPHFGLLTHQNHYVPKNLKGAIKRATVINTSIGLLQKGVNIQEQQENKAKCTCKQQDLQQNLHCLFTLSLTLKQLDANSTVPTC